MTATNLKDPNIFIMRALTKFFAVPGLRLGYGIYFDEELKANLDKKTEPWSVNSFADIAGQVMLKDEKYITETEAWIEKEKKWFYEQCNAIHKIKAYKTNTNFILLKLLANTSEEVREKMLEYGILIRDASNFVGLDNQYIRLAIKDRENNTKVIEALNEVVR